MKISHALIVVSLGVTSQPVLATKPSNKLSKAPSPVCDLKATPVDPICEGKSVSLTATTSSGDLFEWRDASDKVLKQEIAPGVSIPAVQPVVSPSATSIYTVRSTVGLNLVKNGDFDQAMTNAEIDALSDYNLRTTPGDLNPYNSEFGIGHSAKAFNNAWFLEPGNPYDPYETNPPSGNMLVFDGSSNTSLIVYKTTIDVEPNKDYVFSAWVCNIHSLHSFPYKLQFTIGTTQLDIIDGSLTNTIIDNTNPEWFRYHTVWPSGSMSGTIEITLKNTNNSYNGNDFALDNISFQEVCEDNVQVVVNENPSVILSDQEVCEGLEYTIDNNSVTKGTGNILTHTWKDLSGILKATDVQNPVVIGNAGVKVYPLTYTVTDENKCSASETIDFSVKSLPITTPMVREICPGTSFTLAANPSKSYIWEDKSGNVLSGSDLTVSDEGVFTYNEVVSPTALVCAETGTLEIKHYLVTAPVINGGKPEVEFCEGDYVDIDAGAYSNYDWSDSSYDQRQYRITTDKSALSVTITDANGCKSSSNSIDVIVNANPQITGLNKQFTCEGPSYQIKNSGVVAGDGSTLTHLWQDLNSILEDVNVQEPIVKAATVANPSYGLRYTVSDENGCSDALDIALEVGASTIIPLVQAEICPEGTYSLTTPSGKTYNWFNGTSPLTNLNVNAEGVYSFVEQVPAGTNSCGETGSIEIQHYAVTTPVLNGGKASIDLCDGEMVDLDAGSYAGYDWNDSPFDEQLYTISSSKTALAVTVTDGNGCKTTSNAVDIAVHTKPQINGLGNLFTCEGNVFQIENSGVLPGDGSTLTHLWQDLNSILEDVNVQEPIVKAATVANPSYGLRYTVSDENGCSDALDIALEVGASTIIPLVQAEICPEGTYSLTTPSGKTYNWFNGTSLLSVLNVNAEGVYSFVEQVPAGTNSCGETGTIEIQHYAVATPVLNGGKASIDLCDGEMVNLDAGSYAGYDWNDSPFDEQLYAISSSKTALAVTVTDGNGCKTTSNAVDIAVHTNPQINGLGNLFTCEGNVFQIENSGVLPGDGSTLTHTWVDPSNILEDTDVQEPNVKIATVANPAYNLQYVVSDEYGCEDVVDIELEVGSIPVIPLVQEEICPDGNFLLSSPSGKNYEWYVGNAPSITPVSDLSVNAEGLYSFIEQIPDGVNACGEIGTLEISHYASPNPEINDGNQTLEICPTLPVDLSVELSDNRIINSYNWSEDDGSADEVLTTNSLGTLIFVSVIDNNNCEWRSNDVTLEAQPQLSYMLDLDQRVCPYKPIELQAEPGFVNYSWLLNGVSVGTTASIMVDAAGTYTSVVNDGCYEYSADVDISESEIPVYQLSEQDPFCPNEDLMLDAAEGGVEYETYRWLMNGTEVSTNRYVKVREPGIYKSEVYDGCYALASQIEIEALPEGTYELNQDQGICPEMKTVLEANSDYQSYRWEKDGVVISNNQMIEVTDPGTYVSIVNDGCYTYTSSVELEVYAQPKFTTVTTIPGEAKVIAGEGQAPFKYAIVGPDIDFTNFSDENHFEDLFGGDYQLIVRDDNGCENKQLVNVPHQLISAPNFFSPNGDGVNDYWEIKNIHKYPNSTVIIYDRFGKTLAEYKGSDKGWDGMYNGRLLPMDAYWYVVVQEKTELVLQGFFTLLRK